MVARMYVVAYDITDNTRRSRVVKVLEGAGDRVNLSVFECPLTDTEFDQVHRALKEAMDSQKDTVILYKLCANCRCETVQLGRRSVRKLDAAAISV